MLMETEKPIQDEQYKTREEWENDFISAFGEFNQKLENNTLSDLPKLSEGIKKWKKWAEEIGDAE